jgi:four helix bundle protein
LIAYASALELETQVIIAKELHFANYKDYQIVEELLNEILRMLNTLTAKLEIIPSH